MSTIVTSSRSRSVSFNWNNNECHKQIQVTGNQSHQNGQKGNTNYTTKDLTTEISQDLLKKLKTLTAQSKLNGNLLKGFFILDLHLLKIPEQCKNRICILSRIETPLSFKSGINYE